MTCPKTPSTLETLPDELLLIISTHLTARELYHSLYPLNHRFQSIANSVSGLFLTMTGNEYHIPVDLSPARIIKLTVDRFEHLDLHQFRTIRSLECVGPSDAQLRQLCTHYYYLQLHQLLVDNMPNTLTTAKFHQTILSGGFPLLRKCKLSQIDVRYAWTLSPRLRGISIADISHPWVFERVLTACPNLSRLDLHVRPDMVFISTSAFQHVNLKTLFLTGSSLHESFTQLLWNVPGLIHLNVKWPVNGPSLVYFQHLSDSFKRDLLCLRRFECELMWTGRYEDIVGMENILERLHPCFMHRLHITKLKYDRTYISIR